MPAEDSTSRLSPYLHFGEISPHQVWRAARMPRKSGEALRARGPEIPVRDRVARFLAPPALSRSGHGPVELAAAVRGTSNGARARRPSLKRGSAGDRLSHRRRRHAAAVDHGLDAQPRAHDRRLVLREGPAGPLAQGRGMVLGHAGRRGRSQQRQWLAVDGRNRRGRRAVLPRLQSDAAGREVRSRRRLCRRSGFPNWRSCRRSGSIKPWEAPADVLADPPA